MIMKHKIIYFVFKIDALTVVNLDIFWSKKVAGRKKQCKGPFKRSCLQAVSIILHNSPSNLHSKVGNFWSSSWRDIFKCWLNAEHGFKKWMHSLQRARFGRRSSTTSWCARLTSTSGRTTTRSFSPIARWPRTSPRPLNREVVSTIFKL